jgi:hypothetical protein
VTVSSSLHNLSPYVLSILVMLLLLAHHLMLLVVGHLRPHHLQLLLLACRVIAAVRVGADAEVTLQVFNPDRAVVCV